jgi:Glycosyltransferase family 87
MTPQPSTPEPRSRLFRLAPLLLLILAVAPLFHLHVINRDFPPAQPDLVPVWVGSRAALQHNNPYSDDTTRKIQIAYYGRILRPIDNVNKMAFAYPAQTIVLFSPFAWLPWSVVRVLFLILLPTLTAATVPLWLTIARINLTPGQLLLTLLLTLASWPVMWGVHQMQPTLIVAALAAAGCFFLQRGNGTLAGILFALATIKPQLVGPLILWLCLWTLLRRQWNFLLAFALTLSALLASATWLVPGWLSNWRAAAADYVVYRHLRPDLQFLFGHWPGLFLELLVVAGATVALWTGLRCAPDSRTFVTMCAIALAATVCVIPNETLMIYNHVLLLPACLLLVFGKPASRIAGHARSLALAQLGLDYLAVPITVICEFLAPKALFITIVPFLDFLLPVLLTLTLVIEVLLPAVSPQLTRRQWTSEALHG